MHRLSQRAAEVAVLAMVGAAGVATAFPWWSDGTGSARPPLDLAAVMLSGQLTPIVPRWVGAVFFLPLVAAALALTSLATSSSRSLRSVSAGALLVSIGALAVCLLLPSRGALGAGGWAVVGLTGCAIASTVLATRHTRGSP